MKLRVNSVANEMPNQTFVLISVLSVIAFALAQGAQVQSQPQSQPQPQVVRETNNNDGSGNYLFTYVTIILRKN